MSQITSHVLDTAHGHPAQGIPLTLYTETESGWKEVGSDVTNGDGRSVNLLDKEVILPAGIYRLNFKLSNYLIEKTGFDFYPHADITFRVAAGGEHYHIPLLLNPFGYTTYRGS